VIAATTQALPFFGKMAINWFDVAILVLLGLGFYHGRKNGMSKEVLSLFQWLSVVVVCGWLYPTVAQFLVDKVGLRLLTGYILGYIMLSLALFYIFSFLKRTLGLRLFKSNLFGNAEYYLGMFSGVIRFACALLFVLAFLNARYYTPEEIQARHDYEQRWYGSDFFPGLQTVQDQVFGKSFTGPYIKKYLGHLLIKPTSTGGVQPKSVQPKSKRPVIILPPVTTSRVGSSNPRTTH
jgi:uncharacterized membrane protein required for colicin V production